MVQLPATLNVDDRGPGAIASWEAPGIFGVDTHVGLGEVVLVHEQRIIVGLDVWRRARSEPLTAGYLMVLGNPLEELRNLRVGLDGRLLKLDLEPRAKVGRHVSRVELDGALNKLSELLRGHAVDERQDSEVHIALLVLGAGTSLADKTFDDVGAVYRLGSTQFLRVELDGNGRQRSFRCVSRWDGSSRYDVGQR